MRHPRQTTLDPRRTTANESADNANERTFLAWIRTALGFIAAGVALSAVVQLSSGGGPEVRVASILLVGCGLVSGVGALLRWAGSERAMRLDRPLPSSPLLLVLTVLVSLAAVAALLVLVTG